MHDQRAGPDIAGAQSPHRRQPSLLPQRALNGTCRRLVWREWNGLWTAEEGQHAIAIRSYLLTSRNCDPYELEDDRMATMQVGYQPNWKHPAELLAYTSAQELATRVSHRNAGKITEDEVAFELMRQIASDENHHFMFYKGVWRRC